MHVQCYYVDYNFLLYTDTFQPSKYIYMIIIIMYYHIITSYVYLYHGREGCMAFIALKSEGLVPRGLRAINAMHPECA